ncbi:hypothetical protein XENOCAPTIV_021710, partial [Xenoophorus captivus]
QHGKTFTHCNTQTHSLEPSAALTECVGGGGSRGVGFHWGVTWSSRSSKRRILKRLITQDVAQKFCEMQRECPDVDVATRCHNNYCSGVDQSRKYTRSIFFMKRTHYFVNPEEYDLLPSHLQI